MPRVSVIMNCLNGEKFLKEAMDSTFAQDYADWEIIFWDNASTDKSAEIARSYGPKVKYFKSDKTTSLGEARNRAISVSKGEFITFLDTDDYWLQGKLSSQVSLMDAHPGTGFIHTNFYVFDVFKGNKKAALTGTQPTGRIFRRMLKSYAIGILSVMVRKRVLDSCVELFDPNLTYASDYDLFLRIIHDTDTAYIDKLLAVYRMHSGMNTLKAFEKNQKEIGYVINKLAGIYPNFNSDYSGELRILNGALEYSDIWAMLLRGDVSEVRRKTQLLRSINMRLTLLYISSFLPHGIWLAVWKLLSAIKGNKEAKQVILKYMQEQKKPAE
ncbi:MAG: glycosyltransferase [Elusimicrobiota bacterium]